MRKPIDIDRVKQVKKELDHLKKVSAGRPFILFTMFNMCLNYLKLLYYLKNQGATVVLLVADDRLHGAIPLKELGHGVFFDYIYASNPYDLEMPLIISEYEFDLIHAVVGSGPPFPVCEMIKQRCSPVIVEYCDIREIMFDRPDDYNRYMGVKDWDTEQDAWRVIFTKNDGIVFKDSPETIHHLGKRHGKTSKALQFMSYPSCDFMPSGDVKPHHSTTNEPIRLVYAGSVHNNPLSHAYPVHKTLLDIVNKIVSQNMACTVINAMDVTGSGYEPYLDLAEKNRLFSYRFAIPQDQLVGVLAGSDFGLFYFDYSNALEAGFFHKTTFGSKTFNYLEARLPVLVSSTTEYMAKVVSKYGIGLVIENFSEIDHLHDMLRDTDMNTLLKNIDNFSAEFSMERQMPRLLDFYNTISGKTLFDIDCYHLNSIISIL